MLFPPSTDEEMGRTGYAATPSFCAPSTSPSFLPSLPTRSLFLDFHGPGVAGWVLDLPAAETPVACVGSRAQLSGIGVWTPEPGSVDLGMCMFNQHAR